MRDEEAIDGAVEYDDLDPIIGLSAVTTSFSCGMLSGPKMLRGGWSKVARQ